MPSSWTRTRRASANAASASACRPHRYSASISCPLNRSLSGCARTSSVSWPTASAARPSSSRISMCSSVTVSRCSPSPALTISAHGPGMPSSATPCHSPQRRLQRRRRRGQVARPPGLARGGQPSGEQPGVELARRQPQQVTAAAGQQHLAGRPLRAPRLERRPQPGDVHVQRVHRSGGQRRRPRSRRSAHRARPTGSPAPPAARGPPAAAAPPARARFRRARPAPARARPPAAAARRRPARHRRARCRPGRRRQARRRKSRSPPSGRGLRRITPDRNGASPHRPLNWHFQSALREQQEALGDS